VEHALSEAERIQEQVNQYKGVKGSKDYLYLEEMLTRLMLKLDAVDSEGKEEIRNVRRKAVRTVQASIDHLELKAMANEPMDTTPAASNHGNRAASNHGNRVSKENDKDSGIDDSIQVNEMVLDSEINC